MFTHHGIYIGNGEVIHYDGKADSIFNKNGSVVQTSLEQFLNDKKNRYNELYIVNHQNARYSGKRIVQRALSRLGESRYSIFSNNCEHFCTWCVEGSEKAQSQQVQFAVGGSISLGLLSLSGTAIAGCSWPISVPLAITGLATGLVGGTSLANSKILKSVANTAEAFLKRLSFI